MKTPPIKVGSTVRLKVQSGIVTGTVTYLYEEKLTPMVRISSGNLVYNVPQAMLVAERKTK